MGCDPPCVSFVFSCGYLGLFYFSFVHICVLFRFLFVFLVFGCGSSAHNEDIVRFRCGGESQTLFVHLFVKFFSIFVPFLGSLYLFDWFLISNSLIISCT